MPFTSTLPPASPARTSRPSNYTDPHRDPHPSSIQSPACSSPRKSIAGTRLCECVPGTGPARAHALQL
ncbi:hypothetical protein HYPSUDRAFT_70842 [Hypholoma sublateritium FD-334 SS-4]|uniref:Uncharacterized protein n=1 Tax=Hypholoma sublateritium (strain FD-334 SS-4) TaxID=945553 RepID=A0A0D2NL23_HYPSF|nr:hypothetical protein HYPSUDRAFT_70842 [Hypholoma sublateritium FD-334 SS-4]